MAGSTARIARGGSHGDFAQLTGVPRCKPPPFRIRDDGRGFSMDTSLSVSGGHFGLLDRREWADKIGARFVLQGEPGAGTGFVVTLATGVEEFVSEPVTVFVRE